MESSLLIDAHKDLRCTGFSKETIFLPESIVARLITRDVLYGSYPASSSRFSGRREKYHHILCLCFSTGSSPRAYPGLDE